MSRRGGKTSSPVLPPSEAKRGTMVSFPFNADHCRSVSIRRDDVSTFLRTTNKRATDVDGNASFRRRPALCSLPPPIKESTRPTKKIHTGPVRHSDTSLTIHRNHPTVRKTEDSRERRKREWRNEKSRSSHRNSRKSS